MLTSIIVSGARDNERHNVNTLASTRLATLLLAVPPP